MNITAMKIVIFITFAATGYCLNDTNETYEMTFSIATNETDSRKRYGYGFYSPCNEHEKTFKCMTKCQSLGYEVYRLDLKCKCTCHEMRSTLALPYFKWLTTGTPRRMPTTRSARLYDVVGTLSPFPSESTTVVDNNSTCPSLPTMGTANVTAHDTIAGNKTVNGNDTIAGNKTVNENDTIARNDTATENNATENNATENNATENNATENNATENNATENNTTENEATLNNTSVASENKTDGAK